LGIQSENQGFLFNPVRYDVSNLKEAISIADTIIEEKLKELG
jgi:hypothetical protein